MEIKITIKEFGEFEAKFTMDKDAAMAGLTRVKADPRFSIMEDYDDYAIFLSPDNQYFSIGCVEYDYDMFLWGVVVHGLIAKEGDEVLDHTNDGHEIGLDNILELTRLMRGVLGLK